MVALDAGQSEIASMLYSRMNIKCSVSVSPRRAGAAGSGGRSSMGSWPCSGPVEPGPYWSAAC